jgi:hypothetical protein
VNVPSDSNVKMISSAVSGSPRVFCRSIIHIEIKRFAIIGFARDHSTLAVRFHMNSNSIGDLKFEICDTANLRHSRFFVLIKKRSRAKSIAQKAFGRGKSKIHPRISFTA